jgi:hypothetical protein
MYLAQPYYQLSNELQDAACYLMQHIERLINNETYRTQQWTFLPDSQ